MHYSFLNVLSSMTKGEIVRHVNIVIVVIDVKSSHLIRPDQLETILVSMEDRYVCDMMQQGIVDLLELFSKDPYF